MDFFPERGFAVAAGATVVADTFHLQFLKRGMFAASCGSDGGHLPEYPAEFSERLAVGGL